MSEQWGKCQHCAGTGDKFDFVAKDWVYPLEKCDNCGGWGEAPVE